MYFAHSSNISRGTYSPQPYKEHVVNVFEKAQAFFKDSIKYSKLSPDEINFLLDVVSLSAIYHDLGKLSEQPQSILSKDYTENSEERMLNHVDAGVACLLKKYESSGNIAYLMAAFLVNAHHIGLANFNTLIARIPDKTKEIFKEIYTPRLKNFRDNRDIFETYGIGTQGTTVKDYIDQNLKNLEDTHDSEVGINYTPVSLFTDIPHSLHSISYRMAFSCLVDADHTDTEIFYSNSNFTPFRFGKLRAGERTELLDNYIKKIPKDPSVSPERVANRQLLGDICHSSPIPNDISFFALDCPVGTGKTLNGFKYVLRLATDRNCDRLFNIIPYTNIISQTVEVLRKSILFDGEDEHNVNEIHSKVEFQDKIWMRKYSHKWNAPVNVSTMVQFAESLTSNKPSACRKLHWFSNSVIFFDEFDKSMAHENWNFFLEILKDMAENFNCVFVFASGTSAYYWEIFEKDIRHYVHYIIDKKSARKFGKLERYRCKMKKIKKPFRRLNGFVNHVFKNIESKSSAVIVCNTINNACLLANQFRDNKKFSEYEIYELHGWQDPQLKESILVKIKIGLKDLNRKILVIATSVIECGVDLSFQIGWREKCGPLSLLQCIGRINRGGIDTNALCYIFEFHESLVGAGNPLTENPQLSNAIEVFDSKTIRQISPNRCTGFVTEELRDSPDGDSFLNYENAKYFKSMGDEFRVIDSMTALVIVNPEIVSRIHTGEQVQSVEISRNSVQLWYSKIEKIQKLFADELMTELGETGYYSWEGGYDSESGIGKTMLTTR